MLQAPSPDCDFLYVLKLRSARLNSCKRPSSGPFRNKPHNRDATSYAFHSLNLIADPGEI